MIRLNVILAVVLVALAVPVRTQALMSLRPGDAPPPFTLRDLSGAQLGSDSLKGSPAVVLFWSTWSPRSAELLDDFKLHAATYGGKGLKVVAVNIDAENPGAAQRAAIRDYARSRDLPFPVLVDEGLQTYAAWGIMAHPTAVVLDAGGRISYVLGGYPLSLRQELEEAVGKALGIPPVTRREETPSVGFVPLGMALQHYNLGRHLLAKGDQEKALESFRRAVAADPGFLEAALITARVALASGSLDEAERLARKTAPDAINRGDLRYLLGCLILAKGELDAAEALFRGLREKLPLEGWGEWGLGQAALARGDRAAALPLFRQARALQPDNPEGEAAVRRHFRDHWMRRESAPEEDGFVETFPKLGELRERYRKLFGAVTVPSPAP